MVVLIVKSTQIKAWIPIELHVKWFDWSMTFPKKIAKIWRALRITSKGVWLVKDVSQKIPNLPEDLKQNVNWNQTLLNEVDLNV